MRFLCVRHGESEGNRDRRFCPSPDVPLTPLGREQALQAARTLQTHFRPWRIFSSPYRRAWETAAVIAELLDLPVDPELALRERDIGIYAGQPYDAILEDPTFTEVDPWNWRPRGGETLVEVAARVVPAVEQIAKRSIGREIVLVTHAGVIAALCATARGQWDGVRSARNGEIVVIDYRDGCFSLAA